MADAHRSWWNEGTPPTRPGCWPKHVSLAGRQAALVSSGRGSKVPLRWQLLDGQNLATSGVVVVRVVVERVECGKLLAETDGPTWTLETSTICPLDALTGHLPGDISRYSASC